MAISRKKANKLASQYHASMPASSQKEVDLLIECNAQLGHDDLEVFVAEQIADFVTKTLRKRGFLVNYVKFQANNNWRLVYISWTASEFLV